MTRAFRADARAWLAEHCPPSMRQRVPPEAQINGGYKRPRVSAEAEAWLASMVSRGWTVPTWPQEYGGAGLSKDELVVLLEEMQRIGARPPLGGMGVTMIGPTLLEFGSDDQKARHLPPIATGETAWCQGYSEPGAGSDLASLATYAEDCGDHFVVNGSKIWTSGAQHADWMFCLVRTDKDAPKHQGISFVLLSMEDLGVTVKPIDLINGKSPFCQTFLDNVVVPKNDLVGSVNKGWTIGKRLLQHERSGLAALAAADASGPLERIKPSVTLPELAASYGTLEDLRSEIAANEQQRTAFALTQRRAVEEAEANTPGAATSIFKYVEANYVKEQLEIQLRIRGSQGLGWQGESFSAEELDMGKLWLEAKSISIAGGSNEVQLNIIAKRVLGLPD